MTQSEIYKNQIKKLLYHLFFNKIDNKIDDFWVKVDQRPEGKDWLRYKFRVEVYIKVKPGVTRSVLEDELNLSEDQSLYTSIKETISYVIQESFVYDLTIY